MELSVAIPELKKALAVTKPGLFRYTPVLTGARLEADGNQLHVTTSSIDTTIDVTIPADVISPGVAIVPHKALEATVKGKGDLRLVQTSDDEVDAINGLTHKLSTLELNDWPADVNGPWKSQLALESSWLRAVLPAAATDESLPIIAAVYLDGFDIVATDRYRMHIVRRPHIHGFNRLLVPAKPLRQIVKVAEHMLTAVSEDGRHVRITADNVTWTLRTGEGEYVPYAQLIPMNPPCEIAFDQEQIVSFLKQVVPVLPKGDIRPLRIEPGSPIKATINKEYDYPGYETVVDGTSTMGDTIGLNPGFLLDLLSDARSATLRGTDSLKPVVLNFWDDEMNEHIRLQMPVRL